MSANVITCLEATLKDATGINFIINYFVTQIKNKNCCSLVIYGELE